MKLSAELKAELNRTNDDLLNFTRELQAAVDMGEATQGAADTMLGSLLQDLRVRINQASEDLTELLAARQK